MMLVLEKTIFNVLFCSVLKNGVKVKKYSL